MKWLVMTEEDESKGSRHLGTVELAFTMPLVPVREFVVYDAADNEQMIIRARTTKISTFTKDGTRDSLPAFVFDTEADARRIFGETMREY